MFIEESIWISKILKQADLRENQSVLDLGSSTESFRCLDQPFIDYHIFRPLRNKGIRVIHVDSKKSEGVDIVCDLSSVDSEEIIRQMKPSDVVICANFLEHVVDRNLVLARVKMLTKAGGLIIITVPYRYRYHEDPIDTLYRPSNIELEELFAGENYQKIASEILEVQAEPDIIPAPKKSLFVRFLRRIQRAFRWDYKSEQPNVILNQVSVLAMRKPVDDSPLTRATGSEA